MNRAELSGRQIDAHAAGPGPQPRRSHSGTSDFWRQRVTAVAMVLLIVPVIVVVMMLLGATRPVPRRFSARRRSPIIMLLFIIASAWHMKIGMQVGDRGLCAERDAENRRRDGQQLLLDCGGAGPRSTPSSNCHPECSPWRLMATARPRTARVVPPPTDHAYPIEDHTYDVVVVGAGGAGLRAVVGCSEAGLRTACITKGISDADRIRSQHKGASRRRSATCTRTTGAGICTTPSRGRTGSAIQDSIEYMVRARAGGGLRTRALGVPFSRTEDGRIYQRPFGGMTLDYGKGQAQRTCAAADRTGHAMLHTM